MSASLMPLLSPSASAASPPPGCPISRIAPTWRRPSLYYHKEALVEEVLSLGVRRTFAKVRHAVAAAPDDPIARQRAAVEAHVAMVLETGNYSAANLRLYGQMPTHIRRRLERTQREIGRY